MKEIVRVENVSKYYIKDQYVIQNCSFQVYEGEFLTILGPSGCGKSTLLRCFNMLENPSSGKVIFDGKELTQKDIDLSLVRRKMGMVFQQFNLFPHLTVLDNITLAPVILSILSKDEANAKALKLLNSIGLKDKANNYPSQLSGGQKQRVAIVRTLIMEPEIILFDEPTSALDPEMVGEVLDLIMEVANRGITMVLVSHEMNFVKKFANKIIFLDEGKISFMGSVDEAFSQNDNVRLQDFLAKTVK